MKDVCILCLKLNSVTGGGPRCVHPFSCRTSVLRLLQARREWCIRGLCAVRHLLSVSSEGRLGAGARLPPEELWTVFPRGCTLHTPPATRSQLLQRSRWAASSLPFRSLMVMIQEAGRDRSRGPLSGV